MNQKALARSGICAHLEHEQRFQCCNS